MAQLVFMDGHQMGSHLVLQNPTTLGRLPENGVTLDDPSVQDRHAVVARKNGVWTIERATPVARVAVNGKEVAEQVLSHGDVLSLGDLTLLFHDETPPAAVETLEEDASSVITRRPHVERAEDAVTNIRRGRRAKEHLETLYRIGADLNATSRLSDLSQALFTHLTEAFKPDRSFLLLCDASGRLVVRDERMNESSKQRGSNKLSKTILAEAVGRREAIRVENALIDPRFSGGDSIRQMRIQSALCAPLVKGDRVLGALLMDIVTPRAPWNDEDLQLIDAIAAQTTTAVETLQQLEREVQFGRLLLRLGDSARRLTSSLSADVVLKEAVDHACLIFECARASVLLADGGHLRVAASNCVDPKIWPSVKIQPGEGFAGKVFQDGRSLLVNDATRPGERSYETSSFVVTPVFGGDAKPLGVLTVTDKKNRGSFTGRDQELLDIFAAQVGIALTNARLYERATTDALTRLCNRANFDLRVDEAVAAHHASGRPLSLIMCDLDHFKSKNDTYGHPAGDRILAEASAILKEKVGGRGLAGRYGGEEFIVYLPDVAPPRAKEIAEDIRRAIEEFVFNAADQPVRCTMSLGVSGLLPGEGPGGLIKRADAALYAAKHNGRNQVQVQVQVQDGPPSPPGTSSRS